MQGSGLNFTQGHYSDPLASLQASLGAGSMFAKTLSSMQQFDQDEAKLQMMRQDRERQAKLDAEHAADRATAADEKKKISGALSATLSNSGPTTDFMNETYQNMLAKGGKKFENEFMNLDGKHEAESAKMQQSLSDFSDKQSKENDLYRLTKFQRLNQYVNGTGHTKEDGTIDNGIGGFDKAPDQIKLQMIQLEDEDRLAKANLFKDQQAAEAAYATAASASEKADALTKVDMIKTRLQYMDGSGERSDIKDLAKELRGGTSSASKKDWETDFNNVAATYRNKHATAPEEFQIALSQDIEKARRAGTMPSKLSDYLAGRQSQTKKGDKDNLDSYVYKVGDSNLLKRDQESYDKIYGTGTSGSDDSGMAALYASRQVDRTAALNDLEKAEAARLGAGDPSVAAAKKKLEMLNRTTGEVLHDDKMNMANAFLKDNLAGYSDPNAIASNAGSKDASTGNADLKSKIVGTTSKEKAPDVSGTRTGNRMFDLDPVIVKAAVSGDKASYHQMLLGKTIESITKNEGTRGDGNGVYDVNGIPHTGYGLKVNELDSWIKKQPGDHRFSYANAILIPSAKDKYIAMKDEYQKQRFNGAYARAQEIAIDNGLSAEATPMLANAVFQLGNGFAKAFAPTLSEVKKGDFASAADHIRSTKWMKQTPDRANQFIAMLNDQATRKGTSHYNPDGFKELEGGYRYSKTYDDLINNRVGSSDNKAATSILQSRLAELDAKREAVLSERSANPWYNIPTTMAITKQADAIGSQISETKNAMLSENNSKLLEKKLLEIEKSKNSSESSTASGKSKTSRLQEQARLLQEQALLYTKANSNNLNLVSQ